MDDLVVVAQHLTVDVGRDAAHHVVTGREHRHVLGNRVDAEIGAGELGDVGELLVEDVLAEVCHVDVDVVLVRSGTAALEHLENHRAGDDVAGREVLDGGGVALHEALAVGVAQDAALTSDGLRDEDAQTGETCRMELVEFHVLQRQTLAEDDAHAVAGQRVGVRRGLVHTARAAGREDDRLGVEDVDLAGGQLVGDDAGRDLLAVLVLGEADVEGVELVEELHVVLDAVLVQRLQDHVTGAVGGVAGTTHGRLAVVAGVPTETTLVDLALGGPVEREAHLLQIEHRVDGLLGHDLDGVLIGEVVTTLDGVEGVPLPVVLLDVGQRGAHAALSRAGVAAGGVELGQNRGAGTRGGFDRRTHPGAAGAHDDDVVAVFLHVLGLL